MNKGQQVTLRNGRQGEIIYESKFGKLLVMEISNTEEEPVIHWHNADGSFYADSESELDIVGEWRYTKNKQIH